MEVESPLSHTLSPLRFACALERARYANSKSAQDNVPRSRSPLAGAAIPRLRRKSLGCSRPRTIKSFQWFMADKLELHLREARMGTSRSVVSPTTPLTYSNNTTLLLTRSRQKSLSDRPATSVTQQAITAISEISAGHSQAAHYRPIIGHRSATGIITPITE